MHNTLRLIRSQPPSTVFSSPFSSNFGRKVSGARFQQAVVGNNPPESGGNNNGMDPSAQVKENAKGENISSFGEGYSTRSDEEGFGGVYGGNQKLPKDEEEKIVHANVPEFDTSQGSEVTEKESACNQKDPAACEGKK